jgi:hypothetical protein
MKIRTILKRLLQLGIVAGVSLAVWNTPWDPPARTPSEISALTDMLNEASSVIVPHKTLGKKIRFENLDLFKRVEDGEELSQADSARYRKLYQQIILNNQTFFWSYDHQVTPQPDVGMEMDNNAGGKGIDGNHDHHDVSARENLDLLRGNLATLETASGFTGPLVRIFAAAKAHKNLTDLMLHFGTVPQTVSVPYVPTPVASGDTLGANFETMLREYKTAQFAPVNSAPYVNALHAGLAAYDKMILEVQDRVRTKLGRFERTLAGQWLSWQSLTPPTSKYKAHRFPRKSAARARGNNLAISGNKLEINGNKSAATRQTYLRTPSSSQPQAAIFCFNSPAA